MSPVFAIVVHVMDDSKTDGPTEVEVAVSSCANGPEATDCLARAGLRPTKPVAKSTQRLSATKDTDDWPVEDPILERMIHANRTFKR